MTFPETLRELARLRPKMFSIVFDGAGNEWFWGYERVLIWKATQDDIDNIFFALDRRVLLRESVTVTGSPFNERRVVRLVATIFDKDWNHLIAVETNETEKNPAMQKALTAVVEENKKGEKG